MKYIMALSSAVEEILKDVIEKEDEAYMAYRELSEKALKSNIRWFLKSFSDARKSMRDKLTSIVEEKVDEEFGYPEEKVLHIQATEHLNFPDEVDVSSLQSVLLYISKSETAGLEYFRSVVENVSNERVKKLLGQLLAEKETIEAKAEKLYHDMIEL